MIRPKPHLEAVVRVENEKLDRRGFIRLDKNEGGTVFSPEFLRRCREIMTADFLTCYPQPYLLLEKLSGWLGVAEKNIILGAGSDALIKAAFELFVEPGKEVVIPQPNYAMYSVYTELFQAVPRFVPYRDDGTVSVDELIAALNGKTALVAISNPNSPVGSLLEREPMTRLLAAARDRNIPVLVDEAYYPYSRLTVLPELARYDNLMVVRTFSKALGLASVRLGYLVAAAEVIGWFAKVRPMYEINAFAEAIGRLALEHYDETQLQAEFTRVKMTLTEELQRLGLRWRDTRANFIHLGCPGRDGVLVGFMLARGIIIKSSGEGGGLADYIRVTIGPARTMDSFVLALREARDAGVV